MNFSIFKIFFTILLFNFALCIFNFNNQVQEKSISISRVFFDIINEFYISNDIKFDFLIYGHATENIKDVINEVSKQLNEKITVNIKHIENITKWNHKFNKAAVILTKSLKNLKILQEKSESTPKFSKISSKFPKKFKFVVYIEEKQNFLNVKKIIERSRNETSLSATDLRFFEYLITNDKNILKLSANLLYSEENCGIFTLKLLNSYDIEKQKWHTKLNNFQHFENFHGCPISFVLKFQHLWYPKSIYLCPVCFNFHSKNFQNLFVNKDTKFEGLTNEIFELMAKKHNFTIHYILSFHNGTGIENFVGQRNFLPNSSRRIFLSSEIIDYSKNRHWFEPFDSVDYYYLVTENDLYTNYEKLFFPFDLITWILIFFTFGFIFGAIFAVHKCSQDVKLLVFGKGIKMPAYNTLGIFFGIAQHRLPRETSSRFTLIIFIFFCLIIRTCYQSMLFEFMTSDMRKPLPESIEDLVKMNYTVIIRQIHQRDFTLIQVNDEIINGRERPNFKAINFIENFKLYYKAVFRRFNQKLAFLISPMVHAQFNRTFKRSLIIMKNEKSTRKFSYSISQNNFLYENFDNFLTNLIPSGIPKYLVDYARWAMFKSLENVKNDHRRILSMFDLEFGFVIWLFACLISFLVFSYEVLNIKFRKWLKEFIALIEILLFLRVKLFL
ncbi:hypothetical protein PVAND_006329 [Polypedilum vanderplanki]|uniref:Ionotropic receptor n=1 Tax=Polypedilum vanderplanki TaxID=319348 RepID=A0A9J6C3B2_POLVA|nr:hypothetical protein PVAND_006329 [Polypedilum vanderplanki]